MKPERVWTLLSLLWAGLAVAAALQVRLSAPRHREILGRLEADLAEIRGQAGRWAREDAFRAGLEAAQAWKPADLDGLAARVFGEGVAKVSPRPAVAAADGWQVREASVELREASYVQAGAFLEAAAGTAPGWRLREIDVRPSAEAGTGALTLVLEALEKKQP